MRITTLFLAVLAAQGSLPPPAAARDFASLARDLVDLEGLSTVDGARLRMVSTWDRTGGNADGFNPAFLKDGVYTVADLEGPGVIRRFYTARPGGQLRIYIDGEPKPAIDMRCQDFFAGGTPPFVRPLVGPMGGANYSYFPIAYSRSARIEVAALPERADFYGLYYQVTYESFPKGTQVEPFRLPLKAVQQAAWDRAVQTWRKAGEDPKPVAASQRRLDGEARVEPGRQAVLADVTGPGVIDRIHLEIESREPQALRSTLLRIRWDAQEDWAVNSPVGDFFGNAFTKVPFRSLPMGLTDGAYYCYFSMPFASRARLVVVNESRSHPVQVRLRVVHRATKGMAPGQGYFHAKWRREETAAVDLRGSNLTGRHNYRMLEASGEGRYLGVSLNVFSRDLNWWGEGDPMIFVDGEGWPPSFHGTGTEEYFNDAWGFHEFIRAPGSNPDRKEPNVVPVSGVLLPGQDSPDRCFGANAVFTFHISDTIRFRKSIDVSVEHGTENNMTNDYASTAYWYARPGATDSFFMRPAHERHVPLPDEWPGIFSEAMKRYGPELRRQLADAAEAIRGGHPTDASRYGGRRQVVGRITRHPDVLGIDPAERDRIRERWLSSRKGGDRNEWAVMDQILLELDERLPYRTSRD
jgi:hypothetical protein